MKNSESSKHSVPEIEACFAQPGLEPTATASDVKNTFRHLAKQTHLDKWKEWDAAERLKALSSAYAMLITWFSEINNSKKSKTPAKSQNTECKCIKVTEQCRSVLWYSWRRAGKMIS